MIVGKKYKNDSGTEAICVCTTSPVGNGIIMYSILGFYFKGNPEEWEEVPDKLPVVNGWDIEWMKQFNFIGCDPGGGTWMYENEPVKNSNDEFMGCNGLEKVQSIDNNNQFKPGTLTRINWEVK